MSSLSPGMVHSTRGPARLRWSLVALLLVLLFRESAACRPFAFALPRHCVASHDSGCLTICWPKSNWHDEKKAAWASLELAAIRSYHENLIDYDVRTQWRWFMPRHRDGGRVGALGGGRIEIPLLLLAIPPAIFALAETARRRGGALREHSVLWRVVFAGGLTAAVLATIAHDQIRLPSLDLPGRLHFVDLDGQWTLLWKRMPIDSLSAHAGWADDFLLQSAYVNLPAGLSALRRHVVPYVKYHPDFDGGVLITMIPAAWPVFLSCLMLTGLAWRRWVGPPRDHCVTCGYNLTGNVSGRCPECGNMISAA